MHIAVFQSDNVLVSPVCPVLSDCSSPFCHTGSSQAPAAITKRVKLGLLQKQHKAGISCMINYQLVLQLLCTPQAQGSLHSGSSRSTALEVEAVPPFWQNSLLFTHAAGIQSCSGGLQASRSTAAYFQELFIETLTQLCKV